MKILGLMILYLDEMSTKETISLFTNLIFPPEDDREIVSFRDTEVVFLNIPLETVAEYISRLKGKPKFTSSIEHSIGSVICKKYDLSEIPQIIISDQKLHSTQFKDGTVRFCSDPTYIASIYIPQGKEIKFNFSSRLNKSELRKNGIEIPTIQF
ncbi:hypothetical protein BH10PAT1_BH10PAT1_0780 [soil metagenome]